MTTDLGSSCLHYLGNLEIIPLWCAGCGENLGEIEQFVDKEPVPSHGFGLGGPGPRQYCSLSPGANGAVVYAALRHRYDTIHVHYL